jgi:hypothetical protein
MVFAPFLFSSGAFAQPHVARIQPDALAKGMTLAIEILAPAKEVGSFGNDGVYLPDEKIALVNAGDSERIVFGPVVISWDGRLMQVPVMVPSDGRPGRIFFQLKNGGKLSAQQEIDIVVPQPKISISGSTIIGDPISGAGTLTAGNTLVVEELELRSPNSSLIDTTTFTLADPDTLTLANPRYHPMTILSNGPIRISNIVLSVSADSTNGGPGGGGGGAGFASTGGAGYTGGGSDSSDSDPTFSNVGSGAGPTALFGGASTTGVGGGATDNEDQGGGGGTGAPFGSSGDKGYRNNDSKPGGFGGGSAGGESPNVPFGGGGGAFATVGADGAGTGSNGGMINGGRFLVPMQGGSGGGGGNSFESRDSLAGSGGGGGGALTIVGFSDLLIQNTNITANGAAGRSGVDTNDAGGGGGSGGAIILASRGNIQFGNSRVEAKGGDAGLGGAGREDSQQGGDGGDGIIRIDGAIAKGSNPIFLGQTLKGITLNIPSQAQGPVFAQLDGVAAVGSGTSDTIRIYYRSPHTVWQFIETKRFLDNADNIYKWKASVPLWYDSLLYVSIMEQIGAPSHVFANYEPDWLLSHLSSGIISVLPRPHIKAYPDILNVGCIKTDTCTYGSIYLYNEGEEKLLIDTIMISNPLFSVENPPKVIGERTRDSIIVKYCPSSVKNDTATMSVISKDTVLTFVLVGCGSALDVRVTIDPLDLGRVHVDSCYSALAEIKNIGTDKVKIYPEQLISGPFQIISPTDTITIGRDSSAFVKVRFCPVDTGSFRGSFLLTEHRDSLVVFGVGTRKLYGVEDTLKLGKLCVGRCIDTTLEIFSSGNDTVTISSVTGAQVISPPLPLRLLPYAVKDLLLRVCPDSRGEQTTGILFTTDADKVVNGALMYTGVQATFDADSLFDFGGLCIGGSDTNTITILNTGAEVLTITSAELHGAQEITMDSLSLPVTIPKGDVFAWRSFFDPKTAGEKNDTLDLVLKAAGCDTTFRIILRGAGSNGEPIFSRTELDFGQVDTGNCVYDSVIVSNVCTSTVTLSLSPASEPFSIISPSVSQITLAAGASEKIVYRYCPKNVRTDSLSTSVTDESSKQYLIKLRGSGRPVASLPFIRFVLVNAEAVAGESFAYKISIDSIAGNPTLISMVASLGYDPLALQPINMVSMVPGLQMNGTETKPGQFDYNVSGSAAIGIGEFAEVTMMPLLSKHDHTSVVMTNGGLLPQQDVLITNGSVNVLRCAPPAGNIVIPGDFSFDPIKPNPASGEILLPVSLGADGALTLSISNMWGEIVRRTTFTGLTKGKHELHYSLTGLGSDEYFITAESWGWRNSQKLIISK